MTGAILGKARRLDHGFNQTFKKEHRVFVAVTAASMTPGKTPLQYSGLYFFATFSSTGHPRATRSLVRPLHVRPLPFTAWGAFPESASQVFKYE